MGNRTHIGAGDSQQTASSHIETLLNSDLVDPTAFFALKEAARWELLRRAAVLLLRIAAKQLR